MKRTRDRRKKAKIALLVLCAIGMGNPGVTGPWLLSDKHWSWPLATLSAAVWVGSCLVFIVVGRSLKLNSIELADKLVGKGEASPRDMANLV